MCYINDFLVMMKYSNIWNKIKLYINFSVLILINDPVLYMDICMMKCALKSHYEDGR